eukprot:m.18453 g.18453  ORF g.18453 m.18453 type:complete len:537 (-) comp8319_c0_seq1:20-1630(-)
MSRQWFHANIRGSAAEKLLMERGVSGSFLVRRSQTSEGDYALSVRRGDDIVHIKIQSTGDYYDLYGGEKFANLSELVKFYTTTHSQLRETNGMILELVAPVSSTDPTSERWFHGAISSGESETILKRAPDNSYLVRSSSSSPGCFVLCVKCRGEVSNVMIRFHDNIYDLGGGKQFPDLKSLIEHHKKHAIIEGKNRVLKLENPVNATRLNASAIKDRFDELSRETDDVYGKAGFWQEFEQLQTKESEYLARSCDEGSRIENKKKNRYKNILPYDDTRVKLQEIGKEVGDDYINACYVDGQVKNSKKRYIASQGCMPATLAQFWQMIWEQNVYLVVMTTNEYENGRHKCSRYWPDNVDEKARFGMFDVKMTTETQHEGFIIRGLEITKIAGAGMGSKRTIYQYHYINWPDHGVPDDREILELLLTVREHKRTIQKSIPKCGPLMVHCSAGIGRTGTVIVIDTVMDRIEEEGVDIDIDIQQTIHTIRSQRSGVIQTAAQYRFVYKAIMDHIRNINALKDGKADEMSVDSGLYKRLKLK